MKFFCMLALLSIKQLVGLAQITYQPGYYLRNDGTKISCLIKNYGWGENPTHIWFKTSRDAAPARIDLESIGEFAVGNFKYHRYTIDVDTSAQELQDLNQSMTPQFRRETALLKVLLEGRATLYLYRRRGITRYYFRVTGDTPQPLVLKKFLSQGGAVLTNQGYVAQLRDSLNCTAADFPDPSLVSYDERGLVGYFITYNRCVQSAFTDYRAKKGSGGFHLSIRPGLDLSHLALEDRDGFNQLIKYSYGSATSFRIGAEAEFILPSNRNKWALVVEPAYRSFSSDAPGGNSSLHAHYKAAQVSAGVRYYMYTGGPSVFYFTASAVSDFPLSSTLQYDNFYLATQTTIGVLFSAGWRIGNRFGAEFKYEPPYRISQQYDYLKMRLSTASLALTYRVL